MSDKSDQPTNKKVETQGGSEVAPRDDGYDRDPKTCTCRNRESGASITYLRSEGYMGDALNVFLFESSDTCYEFKTNFEHGHRQVKAMLPEVPGLSWEERRALSRKRSELKRSLKISHDEIVEVKFFMPLTLVEAEELMRLVQARANRGGVDAHLGYKYTVGFRNRDPEASSRVSAPYVKLDYDGTFSVITEGDW